MGLALFVACCPQWASAATTINSATKHDEAFYHPGGLMFGWDPSSSKRHAFDIAASLAATRTMAQWESGQRLEAVWKQFLRSSTPVPLQARQKPLCHQAARGRSEVCHTSEKLSAIVSG
eukprot:NODE_8416_length_384_cov_261.419453.p1 GENE.NODE_8416_length_384_cov_261.419453~~NODE_8416_length_384_cov_261.419453.p1  ORF type:complete len:119 (+),score=0.26 NODE_8416_length_384_cov_261.419453:3-359(+)